MIGEFLLVLVSVGIICSVGTMVSIGTLALIGWIKHKVMSFIERKEK